MSRALNSMVQFCVVALIILMPDPSLMAQEPSQPQQAPAGRPVPRPLRGEYLYESRGYVQHKPVNHAREFFEVTPGHKAQAIFVDGEVAKTVDLEFVLTMLSPTQPDVFYWVFRERDGRLWAFQADSPSLYGYGVFTNDSGNPFDFRAWVLHDVARRTAG